VTAHERRILKLVCRAMRVASADYVLRNKKKKR